MNIYMHLLAIRCLQNIIGIWHYDICNFVPFPCTCVSSCEKSMSDCASRLENIFYGKLIHHQVKSMATLQRLETKRSKLRSPVYMARVEPNIYVFLFYLIPFLSYNYFSLIVMYNEFCSNMLDSNFTLSLCHQIHKQSPFRTIWIFFYVIHVSLNTIDTFIYIYIYMYMDIYIYLFMSAKSAWVSLVDFSLDVNA